jgi:hypothetical protein
MKETVGGWGEQREERSDRGRKMDIRDKRNKEDGKLEESKMVKEKRRRECTEKKGGKEKKRKRERRREISEEERMK